MVREIIEPNSTKFILNLPKEYVNTKLEIIIVPIEKEIDNDENEIKEFSNYSANTIEEWLDESEDEVWK